MTESLKVNEREKNNAWLQEDVKTSPRFKYYISLGYNCWVHMSLEKYGFRDFTGPFDGYISDLRGVIELLNSDFSDFLKRDTIVQIPGTQHFTIKYKKGFRFLHDITVSLEDEYDAIYAEYKKRIQRFKILQKEPMCFIRHVKDDNELNYIFKNHNYIEKVIKKGNPLNEIIYIVRSELKDSEYLQFPFFVVNYNYQNYKKSELGQPSDILPVCLLETNSELLSFLTENFDSDKRKANYRHCSARNMRTALLDMLFQDEDLWNGKEVIICGTGDWGQRFYQVAHKKCNILCFLSRDPEKRELCCGIPVKGYSDMAEYDNDNVVCLVLSEHRQPLARLKNMERMQVYSIIDILYAK